MSSGFTFGKFVDVKEGFLKFCEAPSGLRRFSNRWCQSTGLGITDTMLPVPLKASTAPQNAVLAL